jgi:F-type H+-transporting ATPase subunit delta
VSIVPDIVLKIAPPFADADIKRIERGFEKLLGHEVILHVEQDPSLIGGFFAYADDKVYDASMRTQLNKIRGELTQNDAI